MADTLESIGPVSQILSPGQTKNEKLSKNHFSERFLFKTNYGLLLDSIYISISVYYPFC